MLPFRFLKPVRTAESVAGTLIRGLADGCIVLRKNSSI
jgi:hypothetical protein